MKGTKKHEPDRCLGSVVAVPLSARRLPAVWKSAQMVVTFPPDDGRGRGGSHVQTIRIGEVSYLNARPLVHGLADFAPTAELVLDLPSRLADRLATGDLDVGLIPIVEYFRGDRYRLVPDIAIASHGPVLSVTLFSRKPWKEIRRVALDVGSRTSAALAPGDPPSPLRRPPRDHAAGDGPGTGVARRRRGSPYRRPGDAGVCPASTSRSISARSGTTGCTCRSRTAWAVRDGVELGPVLDALHAAKRHGQANAGRIAAAEAEGLGLDAGLCRRYLTNIIRYDLGPRERAGIERFYELTRNLGLAPADVATQYCETVSPTRKRGMLQR